MRDIIKLCAILMAVCAASGFVLGMVYTVVNPRIAQTAEESLRASLGEVLPRAERFSAEKTTPLRKERAIRYYEGYTADGDLEGYALLTERQGYQSELEALVGIDPRGAIQRVTVLRQAETPGLGALIVETASNETLWKRIVSLFGDDANTPEEVRPWFQEQYSGLRPEELRLLKEGEVGRGIKAITGATVTSEALTAGIRETITHFMETTTEGGR